MTMIFGEDAKEAARYSRWESAAKTAEERGLVIVLPGSREAFVDLDTEADRVHFERAVLKLSEGAKLSWSLWPSPSGKPGRYHAVVRFQWWEKEMTAAERIAIQAALGSDRIRETLGLLRLWRDEEQPTLFFERFYVADQLKAESKGWEAGCEFAAAESDYDYEQNMQIAERRRKPYSGPWWVWFTQSKNGDVKEGCFEGSIEEVRAELTARSATEVRASCIPYPALPRIGNNQSDCPAFCTSPRTCAGQTSCPHRRACSE